MKSPELGAVAGGGFRGAKFGILLETGVGIPDCIGWDKDTEGPTEGADADPNVGLTNELAIGAGTGVGLTEAGIVGGSLI